MAAPSYYNNTGWEKTMFSWVGKLNYSIKTQLGLNDLSWILSQNGSRLNCPRMFRKLNTSPYAYSSTLTTLEIFIVIESSMFHLSFWNPCFTETECFLWTDIELDHATGSRASPHVPRLKVHVESLCPGKQLCSAMAAGENALTSRSLLCRPLV